MTTQQRYAQSTKGKESKRAWKDKNKDKVNEWKRKWATSENGKASARQWYKKSPRAMFKLYSKSAIQRNLEFNIDITDFIRIIQKPCTYCGNIPPKDSGRNGLDRVENDKGYFIDNIVPCCITCNQMKGKMSVNDFVEHIKKIADFQKGEINAIKQG